MAWVGKKFEQDWVRKISDNPDYYVHRFRDVQGYAGSVSIADYSIYNWFMLSVMELKSTKGKSLPFSRLNMKQRQMMLDELTVPNYIPGYICNFRIKDNPTYWITTEQVEQYIEDADRKSIPIDWLDKNWVPVDSTIRTTRYDYNVVSLIEDVLMKWFTPLQNRYG